MKDSPSVAPVFNRLIAFLGEADGGFLWSQLTIKLDCFVLSMFIIWLMNLSRTIEIY